MGKGLVLLVGYPGGGGGGTDSLSVGTDCGTSRPPFLGF